MKKLVIAQGCAAVMLSTAAFSQGGGTQTVVPFINGMRITTSNSVANIEVRAQSQGPGGCAVEFSTGDKKIGFVAPPFTYSPWTVLNSHIGQVSFGISNSVLCDTGVLAQIRYFK